MARSLCRNGVQARWEGERGDVEVGTEKTRVSPSECMARQAERLKRRSKYRSYERTEGRKMARIGVE
eukprot:763776-Hanusia_phi.AAC.3